VYPDDFLSVDIWIKILEDYFSNRRKAFLVFDHEHVLLHISEYAQEILELEENQTGISTLKDIFELPRNIPDLLLDQNDGIQAVHDITYTTPSGRPKEIRISLEQQSALSGYVVWVEEKSRDLTTMVTKISPFNSFKRLKFVFDKLEVGYIILNKDGIVEDYNDQFKQILQLPGEWFGRNIFTLPAVHENKLGIFLLNSIQEIGVPQAKLFNFRYSGSNRRVKIRWTGISLTDLRGTGAQPQIIKK
jgi:PAS domain-containing protein